MNNLASILNQSLDQIKIQKDVHLNKKEDQDKRGFVQVLHELEAVMYGPNSSIEPKTRILLFIRHKLLRNREFIIELTKEAISNATGVAKPAVERCLAKLQKSGDIRITRRIRIKDLATKTYRTEKFIDDEQVARERQHNEVQFLTNLYELNTEKYGSEFIRKDNVYKLKTQGKNLVQLCVPPTPVTGIRVEEHPPANEGINPPPSDGEGALSDGTKPPDNLLESLKKNSLRTLSYKEPYLKDKNHSESRTLSGTKIDLTAEEIKLRKQILRAQLAEIDDLEDNMEAQL